MREIIIHCHHQGYHIYVLNPGQKKSHPIICLTKERLFYNLNELIRERDEGKTPSDTPKTPQGNQGLGSSFYGRG